MPADDQSPSRSTLPLSGRNFLASDLGKRVVSGVLIGAVALLMLYWSARSFALLMTLIAIAMSWEWGRIVRGGADTATAVNIVAIVAAATLTATGLAGLGLATTLIGAIAVAVLMFGTQTSALSGAGVLYTGVPIVALGWLREDEPLGFMAALFVILTVVVTDIAAYFVGRSVGGPKLWSQVSPNKTWSGLIGGITAAAIAGVLFHRLTGSGSVYWLAVLGFTLGLIAQAGDLAESALKRHFGIKDASGLIPGHGGFMDRMDGIVMAGIGAALIAFAIDAYAPARALLYGS